jgi:hypothetical protein
MHIWEIIPGKLWQADLVGLVEARGFDLVISCTAASELAEVLTLEILTAFYAPLGAQPFLGVSAMPKVHECMTSCPPEHKPTMAAFHAVMETCPTEHKEAMTSAFANAPVEQAGPVISLLQLLRNANVPWGKLATLAPLIAAFFASPAAGAGPLMLAIFALLNPAPVPAPA